MLSLPASPPPPAIHARPPLPHQEKLFLDRAAAPLLAFSAARPSLRLTACVHAGLLKSGLYSHLFVANSLLDAYSKCGRMDCATRLFDRMPQRDVASWTSLMSGLCRGGAADAAVSVFLDMVSEEAAPAPNEFTVAALLQAIALVRDEKAGRMVHGYVISNGFFADPFVLNSLVDMYSKSASIVNAEKLVRTSGCRDVVSWTAVISGCVLNGMFEKALAMLTIMLEDGILPNVVTMLSVVQSCSLLSEPSLFGWAHAWVVKLEVDSNDLVVNSLVEMYAKNGFLDEGVKVFSQFYLLHGRMCVEPDVVAALVHGCTHSESLEDGRQIHGCLIKMGFATSSIVVNPLMGMYAKHGQVESAHLIFKGTENRDVVSWNTIISCFVKSDRSQEALSYLTQLHGSGRDGLVPDFVTMLSSIQACSEMASLQQGQILHGYVIRSGFDCDIFICNALIDMYAKSGRIDSAERVFKEMDDRDIGSWNSMIAAYGIHGNATSALSVFSELKSTRKYTPNAISFASIISACGHAGLAKEGYECFKSMQRDYGIEPTMEHYASMVDLLGRSGKVNEADEFIKGMSINPGSSVWGSLLGACVLYGNVEIAERAAEKMSVFEPDSHVWRVTLSNVYALAGKWEDAAKIRAEMRREGSPKDAGWSSVEVRGMESFRFVVGDTRHPETDRIYEVLSCIRKHIMGTCTLAG